MVAQWATGIGLVVAEEPEPIYPELLPIWHAFWTLSTSRPTGFTVGGIPWAEASRYCADHGIGGAQRLRWVRLLRAMDLVYLGNYAEESRKRREASRGNA